MTDPTEAFDRPYDGPYERSRIDVRYWLRLAIYTCFGMLLVLGMIIAVALTLMILRYINSKPS